MARSVAKRKADTSLDSKQVRFASKRNKDVSYDDRYDAEEDNIVARQTEERSVSPEPKFRDLTKDSSRLSRSREYEEHVGRERAQESLRKKGKTAQKGASTKRTNKFLSDFGATVQKRAQDFNNQLLKYESELATHEGTQLQAFRAVYFSILTSGGSDQRHSESPHGKTNNSVYQMSQSVMQKVHTLVQGFEDATEEIAAMHKSFSSDEAWEKEVDDLREVIRLGRDVGKERLASILTGPGSSERPGSDDVVSDIFYKQGSAVPDDVRWGHIAMTQEKAVRRLASTLPRK